MELAGRELGDAAATFGSVAELRDFFARPWIPATAKRAVATEVAVPVNDRLNVTPQRSFESTVT
jgi:hypothetical protein